MRKTLNKIGGVSGDHIRNYHFEKHFEICTGLNSAQKIQERIFFC